MKGVSVIICCYNSADRLPATLKHLQEQKFREPVSWEIVLIDNAGTDQTKQVAQTIWQQHPRVSLNVIDEPTPGLMHARIKGIQQAQFDYLTFVDDDNWVGPEWVQRVFDLFESNEEIVCCGGKSSPVFEGEKPVWFDHYASSYAAGIPFQSTGFLKPGACLWGAGLCFRRTVWEKVLNSGLPNLLSGRKGKKLSAGEDSEWSLQLQLLGYRLWYDEGLSMQHFISKGRLEINNLIRMHEGFGRAEVVLRVYRSLLDPSIRIKTSWWKEFLATVYYYFKLALLHRTELDVTPFGWLTKSTFIKGYLSELGSVRTQFDQIHRTLLPFKRLLKK